MQDGARGDEAGFAPLLIEQLDAGVVVVTMQARRGPVTLSDGMLEALQQAFDKLSAEADARVIILAANGPAYCAGHDMKEMTARRTDADGGEAYFANLMTRCATMMQTIVRCPKPVIAAVHATATAAGCQLVATCDLAIAADTAKFATPGVNIGLFCSTPMVALSRNVPRKHTMEMLLTGEMIDAVTAAEFGLVNRVVPGDGVMECALGLARTIASKSPLTVAIGKEAFYRQLEMPLAEAYVYAAEVMAKNMMARDAEEGIGAFIEKRAPEWKGE
ncbi:MAG TPA: enoyl-CoA hydratase [Hyphomicrobiaceae bacterium]|nr:enoyl-CoA hydratase [Hyphomicrobiaceae bacterium]